MKRIFVGLVFICLYLLCSVAYSETQVNLVEYAVSRPQVGFGEKISLSIKLESDSEIESLSAWYYSGTTNTRTFAQFNYDEQSDNYIWSSIIPSGNNKYIGEWYFISFTASIKCDGYSMGVSVNQNGIYPSFWVVKQPAWKCFSYNPDVSSNTCTLSEYSGSDNKLIIPEQIYEYTVTKIAERVFSNCTNLISVSIPSSMTQIGNYAFWGCNNLKSISIPDNVTTIGMNAFGNCSNLSQILFWGKDLPQIGLDCFAGSFPTVFCYEYSEIDFWATEMGFEVVYIDDKDLNSPWLIIDAEKVILPDGCEQIGAQAFANNSNLFFVYIPDSITSIADDAFKGCNNIRFICESENIAVAYAVEHNIPYSIE